MITETQRKKELETGYGKKDLNHASPPGPHVDYYNRIQVGEPYMPLLQTRMKESGEIIDFGVGRMKKELLKKGTE